MNHNKKRNTGLLYEFLTRHIAHALVENDEQTIKKSIKLIKKHFKKDSELYREFRLFNALLCTYVQSKETAQRIIETARASCAEYDVEKLDREKSLLIRSINHTLNDPTFYSRKIDEYKSFATVQQLLNEWRAGASRDLVNTALLEEELIEHLTKPKKVNVLDESADMNADDLTINIMLKKIKKKYDGIMSMKQINLMKEYTFSLKSGGSDKLKEQLEVLRKMTLNLLDEKKDVMGVGLTDRVDSIKALLSTPVTEINDKVMTRYLRIAQLHDELSGVN